MNIIYDSEYSIYREILSKLSGNTTRHYDSSYQILLAILAAEGGDVTVHYDSVYEILLALLNIKGGDMTKHYDSSYSILLAILNAEGGDITKHFDSSYEILLDILDAVSVDSPYDAATTAILQETFPTYWNDIKAYGVAHPEMVPFINEDAYLICSLMDVGVTRWLTANGVVFIELDIKGNENTTVATKFKQKYASTENVATILGDRTNTSKSLTILLPTTGGSNRTNRFGDSTYNVTTKFELNTSYDITLDSSKLTVGDVSYNIPAVSAFTTTNNLKIFSANGFQTSYYNGITQLSKVVIGGDSNLELHPFVRNGVNGFIDVLSNTFYTKQQGNGYLSVDYDGLTNLDTVQSLASSSNRTLLSAVDSDTTTVEDE